MDRSEINNFVEELAKEKVSVNVFNQYSYQNPDNELRRKNLRLYFNEICNRKPECLLVSEAPGYLGARLTGVPFTSEFILLNGIQPLSMFGRDKGYRKTSEFDKVRKEQSATIVWKAIKEIERLPLSCPSFPFHPHKIGNIWSNRKPTIEEIRSGQHFLKDIFKIFKIKKIVAVGRVAERSLHSLGVACDVIRHPANGGATKFREGLFRIMKEKMNP